MHEAEARRCLLWAPCTVSAVVGMPRVTLYFLSNQGPLGSERDTVDRHKDSDRHEDSRQKLGLTWAEGAPQL